VIGRIACGTSASRGVEMLLAMTAGRVGKWRAGGHREKIVRFV
jgi:hypothetical protein